jgi:ubiquinone biosynthesis protein
MVEVPAQCERRAFTADVEMFVSRYHDISGGNMGLGTAFLEMARIAEIHRAPVPSGRTLLAKAILNLDGMISVLSPELDPVALIREYMLNVMETRLLAESSSGKMFSWALDVWTLLKNASGRADVLLGKLANDQLTIQFEVQPTDETRKEIRQAVSRLSAGMLAASVIIAVEYLLGGLIGVDRTKRRGPGR